MKLVRENINFERGQDPLDAMKVGKEYAYNSLGEYIRIMTKSEKKTNKPYYRTGPSNEEKFEEYFINKLSDLGCKHTYNMIKDVFYLKDISYWQNLKNTWFQTDDITIINWLGFPKTLVKDKDSYNLYRHLIDVILLLPVYDQIEYMRPYVEEYVEEYVENI